MQAIILAAGMGKRLGHLTQDNTKAMVKVNGTSLIERMLRQIDKQNFERIIIVIGYKGKKLQQHIAQLAIETPIFYVNNPIYDQTNNIYSLYLAKDYLMEQETILFESDLIFEDIVLEKLIRHPYPNLALVAKFESWMDGTVLTIDEKDHIKHFIAPENFLFEDIPHYYKTVNIYKFSKEFSNKYYVPFLIAYSAALGNNEYYEQVLKVITLLDEKELKVLRLAKDDFWYEIDDIQDLDIAESIFAPENGKLQKIEQRYGGYWRYPSLLDFCYLVNPFFPSPKLIAEIKSNFERLISEYPSGMGVNSLLAAKNFRVKQDYIVIGNGAAELIKSLTGILQGKAGIIYPTFEEYPNRLPDERIVPFCSKHSDFHYTAQELIIFFDPLDISVLLIVNPDNPSGNYIDKKGLIDLCEWSKKKGIRLVVDESFVDFAQDEYSNTLIDDTLLERFTQLTVIKSISKSYGVPGLRLGVLASGDKQLVQSIKHDVAIWNINSFAEFFMQIYGKYENAYKNACLQFMQERERFYHELSQIDWLRVIPSQANYFLCEVTSKFTSSELTQILLEQNILIKDCCRKKGLASGNYIRIAVRNRHDNDVLIKILHKL